MCFKSPLDTVLLFTDASDGASNKKSATEQKYLSARHLLPRARVGGAFLSTRWFPGNPQRLCFWLVSRKDARILRIVFGWKKGRGGRRRVKVFPDGGLKFFIISYNIIILTNNKTVRHYSFRNFRNTDFRHRDFRAKHVVRTAHGSAFGTRHKHRRTIASSVATATFFAWPLHAGGPTGTASSTGFFMDFGDAVAAPQTI